MHYCLWIAKRLSQRVHGQVLAMDTFARRTLSAQVGLEQPDKPVGDFWLTGPSGVGKTETALALADLLYGAVKQLITINMSEHHESHRTALMKGSPLGYAGYGEGVLTETILRCPHSVSLMDEIEKHLRMYMSCFSRYLRKGVRRTPKETLLISATHPF